MVSLVELSGASEWNAVAGFAAAFVLGSVLFFPRPVMCIAAGVVLGKTAIPVALLGSTIGAILAFLLTRFALADWAFQFVRRKRILTAIVGAVDEKSWRLIFLLRLASPIPGTLTSLVFGLSRVPLLSYSTGTLLGLAPQTILFAMLGAAGKEAALSASHPDLQVGLTLVGIVVLSYVTWVVTLRAKARLKDQYNCVAEVNG